MLIFNNLKISTITIGAKINPINSKIFSVGNNGILNTVLNAGTAKIINIKAADASTAQISLLLLNTFVLNKDLLLSLTLNTCAS